MPRSGQVLGHSEPIIGPREELASADPDERPLTCAKVQARDDNTESDPAPPTLTRSRE